MATDIGREYIGAEFMKDLPITEAMPYKDSNIIISAANLIVAYRKDIAGCYGVRGHIIRNLGDESIWIFEDISY